MKKKRFRLITPVVLTALSALLVSGCSGKSAAVAYNDQAYETAAGSSARFNTYDAAAPVMKSEAGEVLPEAAAPQESGVLQSEPMEPSQTARKLIRNANLSMETTSFDILLEGINQTVTGLGGYLEQSDISGNSISASSSSRRYAYLVARIPSDELDSFISKLGEQGNITSKSESTQDVTLQYSDLESRKKSLTIEQERLWELLEKADTLEAVIALEARLSEIRYQLESFESQLRLYDNQVDYSTVSLSINEVQVFTPTSPDSIMTRIQKGFTRNLAGVSQGLVNFFVWFLSSIPVLLLLAVIITILAFILKKIHTRTANKPPKTNKLHHRFKKADATPAQELPYLVPPVSPAPTPNITPTTTTTPPPATTPESPQNNTTNEHQDTEN